MTVIVTQDAAGNTVCAQADDGDVLTLTAPAGKIFNILVFASYGNPGGLAPNFEYGNNNCRSSRAVVANAFANQNSAALAVSSEIFGDPFPGQPGRLYLRYAYGDPV